MRVRRIDAMVLFGAVALGGVTSRLDAVEVTPEGFHVYDALYARADIVQLYDDGRGGTIREYRPDAEVFAPASLASYELRPLADLHPPRNITTDSARMHARGAVSAGRRHEDGIHVAGRLAVWDAALIDKFEAARKSGKPMQLSAGYELDIDPTPGVLADGRRYDAIQRNITINHVAAVPLGRAGTARVLDAADALADAWSLDRAKSLADVAPHRGRVHVDFGRWCRHDAADLLAEIRQDAHQEPDMKKIKIKIDGKDVELELADDATREQIADAVSKAHADAAKAREDAHAKALEQARKDAEAKARADMSAFGMSPEEKAKAKEKEQAEEDKAKADKAREDAHKQELAAERARVDVVGEAKAILGLRFDASKHDADALRLEVIGHVLGDDSRKDAEADRGAIGYLYRQALKQHEDGPAHHVQLLDEIRRARPSANKDEADKPGPITAARADAERTAALPKHLRDAAKKEAV